MPFPEPRRGATCVVTGAASGIGAETARRLAADGHNLTLVDRDAAPLEAVADELRGRHAIEVRTLDTDLRVAEGRDAVVALAHDGDNEIDVLVNCAGLGAAGEFIDDPVERALEQIDINVKALVDLTRLVLPEMIERDSGAIINVASGAGFQPMPRFAVYAATKAFVLTFSESLTAELMGSGVSVTALCPGPTHSGFTTRAGLTEAESATPEIFWKSSAEVANYAVDAARRGRRVAIPSKIYRVASFAGGKSPRAVTLFALDRFWPAADSKQR